MRPLSILSLTSTKKHLLVTSPDEAAITRLKTMAVQSDFHVGMISDRLPLLANLNALENIILGCMYHNYMSLEACRKKMMPAIRRLDLERIMEHRQQFLSRPQRLKVQLLRCLANDCGFILLDTPPRLDCEILERALATLDAGIFLWVCCLSTEQDAYISLGYTHIDLGLFS
jgi:ABC-type lipoprotein export system ATPase subunit